MGNKSSGRTTGNAEKMALESEEKDQTSQEDSRIIDDAPQLVIAGVNQPKAPRRIVKATPPRKISIGSTSDYGSESGVLVQNVVTTNDDDDDDGFEKVNYNSLTASITSPSVARELEQEKAELIKKELKQSATERHRAKRETEISFRRKQKQYEANKSINNAAIPSSGNDEQQQVSATESATDPAPPPVSTLKANPMSRFLSAFSVEEHPENKRSYPKQKEQYKVPSTSNNNDGTADSTTKDVKSSSDDIVLEPYGKKLKQSLVLESENPSSDEKNEQENTDTKDRLVVEVSKISEKDDDNNGTDDNDKQNEEWWVNFAVITTAVTAAAILVATIALRWKRKRSF